MFVIDTKDGSFYTGCKVPSSPAAFASVPVLSSVVQPVTKEEAKRYCETKVFNARESFKGWVRNQGQRGSCNGYAGAKALQRARFRRRLPFAELSGEGLYAQINGGGDNGSLLVDGMNAITVNGVPTTRLVPHEEYRKNAIPAEAWQEAKRFRGEELYQLPNEAELVTALVLGFDVVVAVHVTNDWMQIDGNGLIPRCTGVGNHAVGVHDIRYSTQRGQFEFDHFGSWGTNLHEDGCAFLTWERHLSITVGYHGFYAIRSTTDDPQNPAPGIQ